jgi:hypothetical protein
MCKGFGAMSKIFAAIFLVLTLCLPAQASMLMPSGGWMMDGTTRIRTYTNYSDIYRMSAEKIVSYDKEGSPLTETITFVDAPFSPKHIALGFRNCAVNPKNAGLVAVYSTEDDTVNASWIFDGKEFKRIPGESVTCNKQTLLD